MSSVIRKKEGELYRLQTEVIAKHEEKLDNHEERLARIEAVGLERITNVSVNISVRDSKRRFGVSEAIYQSAVDEDYLADVKARIEKHQNLYQGMSGPVANHPDTIVGPIWNGRNWVGKESQRTDWKADTIFEGVRNVFAPNGDIVPVGMAIDKKVLRIDTWQTLRDSYQTRETYKDDFIADKNVELIIAKLTNFPVYEPPAGIQPGKLNIWFPVEIVRKFRLDANDRTEHYYQSTEKFDYSAHGFVKINNMWVDSEDLMSVKIATNRFNKSFCVIQ